MYSPAPKWTNIFNCRKAKTLIPARLEVVMNLERIALFIAATAAIGAVAFFIGRTRPTSAQATSWAPFTAVMVSQTYSHGSAAPTATGNHIHAVRGDGSWVDVALREVRGQLYRVSVIQNLALRRRVTIDPMTESTTTYPLSAATANRLATPETSCTSDANAPHKSMLGYDVVEVKRNRPGPGGQTTVVDDWDATALNCFPLQRTVTLSQEGVASFRRIVTAISVAAGPPDSALFQVPGNYTERSPSQVLAAFAKRFPGASSSLPPSSAKSMLDGVYNNYRTAR